MDLSTYTKFRSKLLNVLTQILTNRQFNIFTHTLTDLSGINMNSFKAELRFDSNR